LRSRSHASCTRLLARSRARSRADHALSAPARCPRGRRPSYRDPSSATAATDEEGVAYSHEEEMAGRLHDEMLVNSKKSAANLAARSA
jgi:hypothetical protein